MARNRNFRAADEIKAQLIQHGIQLLDRENIWRSFDGLMEGRQSDDFRGGRGRHTDEREALGANFREEMIECQLTAKEVQEMVSSKFFSRYRMKGFNSDHVIWMMLVPLVNVIYVFIQTYIPFSNGIVFRLNTHRIYHHHPTISFPNIGRWKRGRARGDRETTNLRTGFERTWPREEWKWTTKGIHGVPLIDQ